VVEDVGYHCDYARYQGSASEISIAIARMERKGNVGPAFQSYTAIECIRCRGPLDGRGHGHRNPFQIDKIGLRVSHLQCSNLVMEGVECHMLIH
jgi:hypothetical protein